MYLRFSTLLLLFVLTSISVTEAQKLRDDPIKLKFVNLPSRPLPDDHQTYSVNANGFLFSQAGSSDIAAANAVKMDGFKRINRTGNDGGHLRVELYGSEIRYGTPSSKTRTVSSKDKEGKVTKTHYYYYEVPSSGRSNFRIYNPEGEVIYKGDYAHNDILLTTEARTSKARYERRTRDIQEAVDKNTISVKNGVIGSAQKGLKLYDYDYDVDRYNMYLIRKHASEDQWTKHYEKVKTIFSEATYHTASAELKEKLGPSIAFYEMHAKKDPRGDKKLKRIYKAANYNLALLHYSIDEFDVARSYTAKVINSEKKDRRSKLLNTQMDKWETRMEKVGIATIHYKRDIADAIPPAEMAALEAEKEEMEENSTTTVGSVFRGTEELTGTWSLDSEAKDLIFGEGGNIKFMVENGAEMNEVNLVDPDISKFVVAERIFKKMRFVPSAKGGTEASMEILEEIYASDRIKLFKFYPSTGGLSDDKPEFAYQKTGEEFPVSLESTQFLLLKKGLANYFADCPDLAEMAAEGGIEKTKDSLIKAARVYSEICEVVIRP